MCNLPGPLFPHLRTGRQERLCRQPLLGPFQTPAPNLSTKTFLSLRCLPHQTMGPAPPISSLQPSGPCSSPTARSRLPLSSKPCDPHQGWPAPGLTVPNLWSSGLQGPLASVPCSRHPGPQPGPRVHHGSWSGTSPPGPPLAPAGPLPPTSFRALGPPRLPRLIPALPSPLPLPRLGSRVPLHPPNAPSSLPPSSAPILIWMDPTGTLLEPAARMSPPRSCALHELGSQTSSPGPLASLLSEVALSPLQHWPHLSRLHPTGHSQRTRPPVLTEKAGTSGCELAHRPTAGSGSPPALAHMPCPCLGTGRAAPQS